MWYLLISSARSVDSVNSGRVGWRNPSGCCYWPSVPPFFEGKEDSWNSSWFIMKFIMIHLFKSLFASLRNIRLDPTCDLICVDLRAQNRVESSFTIPFHAPLWRSGWHDRHQASQHHSAHSDAGKFVTWHGISSLLLLEGPHWNYLDG